MKPLSTLSVAIGLVCTGLSPVLPNAAVAQTSAPSYQADPDVYKVIFEDENFRVIKSVRKKGEHDKPHAHRLPSVIYFLTDCPTRQYFPDGRTVEGASKAGTAQAVPIIQSHSAENIGPADCESLFVEKK